MHWMRSIDPDLMLVLDFGTKVLTPWFWHATVNQTNARNASREQAALFFSRVLECEAQ